MNKALFVLLFSLVMFVLTVLPSFGGFTIPDDAYRMSELESALQEAKEDDWTLTFLFTSEGTTCPLAERASLDAIRVLEERSIIVYINAHTNDLSLCPVIVGKALGSREAGRFLPITVVVNSDCDRIIDIVPYINNTEAYLERLYEADQKIAKPSLVDRIRDMF